ncbi:hypothetical protein [Pseudooceanicola algae]|uniref:DUF4268 domain-containing protein n=1 Tax=Pseudooceanicola algae TaxID=1537215 RepID=A0A418SBD6_9RHOB|nr:hypothetical protein [Pseudooceanicola algae]QPM91425.1 hypothetical protein PSAL_026780 [Pseudooceanicola algae]
MSDRTIEDLRRKFWTQYLQNTKVVDEKPKFDSNLWVPMTEDNAVILSLGIRQTGGATVFLRGRINDPVDTAGPRLAPHEAALRKKLSTAYKHEGDAKHPYYFRKANPKADFSLPSRWPIVIDWFDKSVLLYRKVLSEVLKPS